MVEKICWAETNRGEKINTLKIIISKHSLLYGSKLRAIGHSVQQKEENTPGVILLCYSSINEKFIVQRIRLLDVRL